MILSSFQQVFPPCSLLSDKCNETLSSFMNSIMMRRVPRSLYLRTFPALSRPTCRRVSIAPPPLSGPVQSNLLLRRTFHASATSSKGLSPTSTEPEPPKGEHASEASHVAEPASITTDEYHDLADQYIDALVLKLEEMAEDTSEKLEVEYSVGCQPDVPSATN